MVYDYKESKAFLVNTCEHDFKKEPVAKDDKIVFFTCKKCGVTRFKSITELLV